MVDPSYFFMTHNWLCDLKLFGGAMIVLWFACVAQPKSVPVNNEPLPEDALTESSEPSEDTASELSDDERYHVGVFNAQAWSSSAQMPSIKAL